MSIEQSGVGRPCQDGTTHLLLRGSTTSLASSYSMEEDWYLSSSADGLECSEDLMLDDAEESEDTCDVTLCHEQHPGSSPDAGLCISVLSLIRDELGRQREMYASNTQNPLKAIYGAQQPPLGVCAWPLECAAALAAAPPPPHPCAGQPEMHPGAWASGIATGLATSPERVYSGWPESSLADRRLLVAWMKEFTRAARLQRETLFLATSLLDRFLAASTGSTFELPERLLQLLAMACVSVAMKFEEVFPLHSEDLVGLALDQSTGTPLYQVSDLGQMEWRLLWVVDWRARAPTSLSFLQHFLLCCTTTASAAAGGGGDEGEWAAGCASGGEGGDLATRQGSDGTKCVVRRRKSSAPGAAADADGLPQSANPKGAAIGKQGHVDESLEVWAHRILDLALLHHCDLVHCHSTVAIACLTLAERAAAAAAAAAAAVMPSAQTQASYGAYTTAEAIAARKSCLVAVQMATGLSMDELAPNLPPCLALLEHLCVMEQQGLLQPQQVWPSLSAPSPPQQQQLWQAPPPPQQQQAWQAPSKPPPQQKAWQAPSKPPPQQQQVWQAPLPPRQQQPQQVWQAPSQPPPQQPQPQQLGSSSSPLPPSQQQPPQVWPPQR